MRNTKGFNDLMQYQAIVDDGVMLLKSGALMAGFHYRGPDQESATKEEAEFMSASFNHAVKSLEDGWMIHQITIRALSQDYPEGDFFEPTHALIDYERAEQFIAEGTHYETLAFVFLTYLPPMRQQGDLARRITNFFVGSSFHDGMDDFERDIKKFEEGVSRFADSFSHLIKQRRLRWSQENDELVHALNLILNETNHPVRIGRENANLIDAMLARDAENGEHLVYDEEYVKVITVIGYPMESYPGILGEIEKLPLSFYWSNRFIIADYKYSHDKIKQDRKKWHQKQRSFFAQVTNNYNAPVNQYAAQMVDELDISAAHLEEGAIIYGHFTSVIVIRNRNYDRLENNVRMITKVFERLGFESKVESYNALEAFLGSLPGHGRENIRKPFIHSLNLADLLPLTSDWTGSEHCPCPPPNYPPNSPPLIQAATVGTTPFRFSLHVDDVGHTLILGPTGSGKSTLLALIASQFDRYSDSQVFIFDKGYSMYPITVASLSGCHYDLGKIDASGGLCPLAEIDEPSERAWASDWLEILLELQSTAVDTVTARDKALLREAVQTLGNATTENSQRTITDFIATVQSQKIKEMLSYYQLGQTGGSYVDGHKSDIVFSDLTCFEMEDLLHYGDKIVVPVLLYLFHQIEKRLKGRPTLLIIDEAWMALSTPAFAERIKEWLKVMRKNNCAVVLATQQVSDIANSPICHAIVESCPTKIFLPNPEAKSENNHDLYVKIMGLNSTQINLISYAVRKRQYYLTSPLGRRLFELGLGPATLSFVGAGSKDDIARIKQMIQKHGERWPYFWLKHRGLGNEAELWMTLYDKRIEYENSEGAEAS